MTLRNADIQCMRQPIEFFSIRHCASSISNPHTKKRQPPEGDCRLFIRDIDLLLGQAVDVSSNEMCFVVSKEILMRRHHAGPSFPNRFLDRRQRTTI